MSAGVQPESTWDSHHLICPYFGCKHSEPYEYFSRSIESTDVECIRCEKTFHAIQHVSVDYEGVPVDELKLAEEKP